MDRVCHCEHSEGMRDNPYGKHLPRPQGKEALLLLLQQSRGATGVSPVAKEQSLWQVKRIIGIVTSLRSSQ